jgi:aldose 1-epimerase
MNVRVFGAAGDRPVHEVTLRSETGAEATVMSWGAVLRDLVVPKPGGGRQRVVLGLNSLDDYIAHSPYFGAVVGRFANRIALGRFHLGRQAHQLTLNWQGKHSLHGGRDGFATRVWHLDPLDESSVALTLVSPDGDQGFPGTLMATVIYRLVGSRLRLEFTAVADAETPVNLCNHSYFNLDGSGSILDHRLRLASDFYTPTDADLIPTGEVRAVAGTPYDFREPRRVGASDGRAFRYDVNYVLKRDGPEPSGIDGRPLALAATLASERSRLTMDVWSTAPGLQVYDGWMLDVPVPGLDGQALRANAGMCLEPQHFPDTPNRPHFPGAVLKPGQTYRQVAEYRFASLD